MQSMFHTEPDLSTTFMSLTRLNTPAIIMTPGTEQKTTVKYLSRMAGISRCHKQSVNTNRRAKTPCKPELRKAMTLCHADGMTEDDKGWMPASAIEIHKRILPWETLPANVFNRR